MKSSLTIAFVFLAIAVAAMLAVPAAGPSAATQKTVAGLSLPSPHASPVVQHGTHLCSQHEHCGSGHLCCAGHCKAVSVC